MRNVVLSAMGLTMIAIAALAALFAPLDDVLINFHWTIPLSMAVFGLILVGLGELLDR